MAATYHALEGLRAQEGHRARTESAWKETPTKNEENESFFLMIGVDIVAPLLLIVSNRSQTTPCRTP